MNELSNKKFWELVDSKQILLLPNDEVIYNGVKYKIKTLDNKVQFEEI